MDDAVGRDKAVLARAAGPILLVEDNLLIRELVAQVLRDDGCEVIEAGTAEEALGCPETQRIVLLVTDIRLPGELDGIGLAARLRLSRPQLKILMVGMDTDHLPGLLGRIADRTLRKPFTIAELERCIAELIET